MASQPRETSFSLFYVEALNRPDKLLVGGGGERESPRLAGLPLVTLGPVFSREAGQARGPGWAQVTLVTPGPSWPGLSREASLAHFTFMASLPLETQVQLIFSDEGD